MGVKDQAQQESYIKIYQLYPFNCVNSRNIKTNEARKLNKCHTIISSQKAQTILSTLDKVYGRFATQNFVLECVARRSLTDTMPGGSSAVY